MSQPDIQTVATVMEALNTKVTQAKARKENLEKSVARVSNWIAALKEAQESGSTPSMMSAMVTVYASQHQERVDEMSREIEQIDLFLAQADSPILKVRQV